MEEPEIRVRLHRAGDHYLRTRHLSIPPEFWRGIERDLIDPAIATMTKDQATSEQVEGAVRKLEFLLDEVFTATRERLSTKGLPSGDELSGEIADIVVGDVLRLLCPLWPYCDPSAPIDIRTSESAVRH